MPTLAAPCAQVILRLSMHVDNPSEQLGRLYSEIDRQVKAGKRVEIAEASKYVGLIASEAGDLDIGLQSYGMFRPSQLNSQFYAIMSSSTLGEALKTAAQYSVLVSDGAPISVSEGVNSNIVHFLCVESMGVTRQYIDCCLSTFIGLTHWLLPWEKPKPAAVFFSYDEPDDRTMLESIFGSNLIFSSETNKIVYSDSDYLCPLGTADETLKLYHVSHTNQELSRREFKIAPMVRNHIFAGLASGNEVSLETASRELNLGPRTLQNRLDDESTGFRDLLDDCRRQLASRLLHSTSITIASISEQLQFCNTSSFHKACNRWFGCPPGVHRSSASSANDSR